MPLDTQGIVSLFSQLGEIKTDVHAFAIHFWVNRHPLFTRTPRRPIGSTNFKMVSRNFKARTVTLGANVLTTDNTITLVDASNVKNGDVIQLLLGEQVEVLADPILSANTISVRRQVGASSLVAGTSGDINTIIGNSRTGAVIPSTLSSPRVMSTTCRVSRGSYRPPRPGSYASV